MAITEPPATPPQPSFLRTREFQVGTLRYTRTALLTVMFWMLWSDLCLQIMENLPLLIPVQLKAFGASDKLVGLIKDSLLAVITILIIPVIGVQSDRHRGPMGRRRPFLLWMTFPTCLFLVLLGFADPIAKHLYQWTGGDPAGLAYRSTGIALIACFAAGFFICNLYVLQIYNFLVVDVIPKETMGLFIGLFRAVGALSGFIFNRWIFGHGEHHAHWVYSGCALLYGAAFLMLIWRVKEGEYPPPEAAPAGRGRLRDAVRRYARECYGNKFYLKFYGFSFFFWSAFVPFTTFIVFFALKTKEGYAPSLGLSMEEFGQFRGWAQLPKFLVFLCLGPLVDRFHSLRLLLVGIGALALTYVAGFFLVTTPGQFLAWWIPNELAIAAVTLAYMAMHPALMPREKFGQYASANQLFFSLGLFVMPLLCGALMDYLKDYRYLFVWSAVNTFIAAAFALALFRHWKRLGGDKGFTPPV